MNIRCQYCRQTFNLGRDYMKNAYNEAIEKKQKYHGAECINCRKLIKVPLKQMKRYVPQEESEEKAEG